MAVLDPNIPLSGIAPVNAMQLLQAQSAGQEFGQRQQEIQNRNALRSVLSVPGAIDETGNIAPQTIRNALAVDPKAGMELIGHNAQMQNQRAQAVWHAAQAYKAQSEAERMETNVFMDDMTNLVSFYKQKKDEVGPDLALEATKARGLKLFQERSTSGSANPQKLERLRGHYTQFDPADAMASSSIAVDARKVALEQMKEAAALEKQRQADIERDKRQAATEAARDERQIRGLAAIAARTGGGQEKLQKVEFIYPRKEDGTVDESKGPIGTRGVTRDGKMVVLDKDGNESTLAALAGGTDKEARSSKVGVTNVVRQNIVKSGVTNAINRLDEIEKKYPNENTSSFFGTHGDNPATRGIYGAGRGVLLNSKQKQTDAAWASLIDEAIPVFTGGLRGSDAFRRFLIEQAPTVGDDKATREEKRRLLRANIQGTSKAFFNAFSSDPKFWGEGVTKDQVQPISPSDASSSPLTPEEQAELKRLKEKHGR